jgi:putative hydroxymethylpyrimidine transporter CytX
VKPLKNTNLNLALIWFGAGVSIAEILTGTFIAPLGFTKGTFAIILGHIIGCSVLFAAGLIGAKTKKSSMETVKLSFGKNGSLLFSSLNVLQLVGWTAVMILSGAFAANSILSLGTVSWSFIIAGLIIVWILIGIKNVGKINLITMSALFVLTIVLSLVIRDAASFSGIQGTISFGGAVELSAAMSLSWLPLISDYTRTAEKPLSGTVISTLVYFVTGTWMFLIGMGATIMTGEGDIAKILMAAGLGVVGLIIVVFSTVTTTFLDAYSGGVSLKSININLKEKPMAIIVTVLGLALAILTPITQFENFLYLIGSVFAPMTAILIVDYYFLKEKHDYRSINIFNIVLWALGFILYRLFMNIETPVGSTLPVMILIGLVSFGSHKIWRGRKNGQQ